MDEKTNAVDNEIKKIGQYIGAGIVVAGSIAIYYLGYKHGCDVVEKKLFTLGRYAATAGKEVAFRLTDEKTSEQVFFYALPKPTEKFVNMVRM